MGYFEGREQAFRGLYGFRPRSYIWGDEVPNVRMITLEADLDEVSRRLIVAERVSLVQIWSALRTGSAMVCRRPQTLDGLVAAGAELRVKAVENLLDDPHVSQLSVSLVEALERRTRFFCCVETISPLTVRLNVQDLGAWSERRHTRSHVG